MEIRIERDELAATDDAQSRRLVLPDDASFSTALDCVMQAGFLPVQSGRSIWWVIGDGALAVISSTAPNHRFLTSLDAACPAVLRFQHVPDHGLVRVALTRDSVAPGDDATAPHADEQLIDADRTLGSLVEVVARRPYLARIYGGQATWVAEIGGLPARPSSVDRRGRVPVAVVAQQWRTPRWLADPESPVPPALHFRYLMQRDPEELYADLRTH